MSKYIDAVPLHKEIRDFKRTVKSPNSDYMTGYICALSVVEGMIFNAPTADVVEVRHGEWKKLYDKAPRYVCTACNHLYNNREYKFCPNCGAKMDGERRSENEG